MASTNTSEAIPITSTPVTREIAAKITASNYLPANQKHIVTFKFKSTIPSTELDSTIQEAQRRFLELRTKCLRDGKPYIISIESGAANSHEGLDKTHEIGFIVTFASQGDRNYYVGTPLISKEDGEFYDSVHDGYKEWVVGFLEEAFVFDFCA